MDVVDRPPMLESPPGPRVVVDGREHLYFAGTSYLGLHAHPAVLAHLGLEPLLDLRIRAGEGVGACLATRLVHDALAVRRLTARTVE